MTQLSGSSPADELAAWTLGWSRQWWDADVHLVHNPAGSFGDLIPGRTVHLIPQSAWVAYGLLGSTDPGDQREADAAIGALLALQYDEPGAAFKGTFARFAEAPYPPAAPTMWDDYDPNWRQFVGTAFALMVEDFPDRLSDARRAQMLAAVQLACEGEEAQGRLTPSYANPALMHAWLDGWSGRRRGDETQVQRAELFASSIIERFDRFATFDEFNSPTYYGIDLYALALWRTFPPTPWFADAGARVEGAIWHDAACFHHAGLSNFCGPYTRSYGTDAERTVTLMALWIWANFGRTLAPLPDLDATVIDHGHDLMAGPLIARLALAPAEEADRSSFLRFQGARQIHRELPDRRFVTAALFDDVMLGAEASDNDWQGWGQFMPVVAHWREPDGTGTLWMTAPRRIQALVDGHLIALAASCPGGPAAVELLVSATQCEVQRAEIHTDGIRISVAGAPTALQVEHLGDRLHRVTLTPTAADIAVLRCTLSFSVVAEEPGGDPARRA